MEKEQQQTAQSAGLIYGLNDRPPTALSFKLR